MTSEFVLIVAVMALLLVGLVLVLRGGIRLPNPPGLARFFEANPGRADADLLARVGALEGRLARLEADRSERPRVHPADLDARADQRADSGRPWLPGRRPIRREDGPVLIAVPDLATTGTRNSAEAFAEFDRRFGVLWALADEGHTDDEIAARTGYPAGQVELILGLRRPSTPLGRPRSASSTPPTDTSPLPGGVDPDA